MEKLIQIATDEDYQSFQNELILNPEKGDVIKGAGGARKVRMKVGMRGKRGGARVIYYLPISRDLIYLLDIFTKSEKSELSNDEKKSLLEIIQVLKAEQK